MQTPGAERKWICYVFEFHRWLDDRFRLVKRKQKDIIYHRKSLRRTDTNQQQKEEAVDIQTLTEYTPPEYQSFTMKYMENI
jgi:hypothetical protein